MIVLHAGAHDGQLLVWGEAPADVPPARSARKVKGPVAAEPYPYDAGAARLAWALAGALPDQSVPGANTTASLWAPTVKGRPVPSSPLIADVPPPPKGASPEL